MQEWRSPRAGTPGASALHPAAEGYSRLLHPRAIDALLIAARGWSEEDRVVHVTLLRLLWAKIRKASARLAETIPARRTRRRETSGGPALADRSSVSTSASGLAAIGAITGTVTPASTYSRAAVR